MSSSKKLVPAEQVLKRQLNNSGFRREWQRTTLARAVATEVVRYRGQHHLSQSALARQLGVSQPVVARLERGDHTPTLPTLERLATELDMTFVVEIDRALGARLRTPTKRARTFSR